MIKIDKFYLQQCIRLRKKWFNAVNILNEKKNDLIVHRKKLDEYEKEFAKKYIIIPNEVSEMNQFAINVMSELMAKADQIDQLIEPYRKEIAKIEDETNQLYEIISNKYPSLTYDEMKQQIITYIQTSID